MGSTVSRSRITLLLAASLLCAMTSSCATHGRPLSDVVTEINATLETAPDRLAVGDTLEVRFPEKPDWNQTAKVRPDGHATFVSVGDIQIEGLTVAEADKKLKDAYAIVFPKLELSLSVATLAARYVFVMGEVHEPGEVPIEGRLSFIEALARAGGTLKETALLESTLLVRWLPREKRQRAWKIDAAAEQWKSGESMLLQPYDVIYVPNTPIDNVNVWIDQYIRKLIPLPYLIPPTK